MTTNPISPEIEPDRISFWMRGDIPADNTVYKVSVGVSINGCQHEHELVVENIGGRSTYLLQIGEIRRSKGGVGIGGPTSSEVKAEREIAEQQFRHYLGVAFIVAKDLTRDKTSEDELPELKAKAHMYIAAASLLKTYFCEGHLTEQTMQKLVGGDTAFIEEHSFAPLSFTLDELLKM
ncbi:MAG: hypothetical protein ABIH34_07810 [Nanoarchaeota archaeon]